MTSHLQKGCVQQKGRFSILEIPSKKEENEEKLITEEKRKKRRMIPTNKHFISHFERKITEQESNINVKCEVYDFQNKKWIDLIKTFIIPRSKRNIRESPDIDYLEINSCEYSEILAVTDEHHTDHHCYLTDEKKIDDADLQTTMKLSFNPLSGNNLIQPIQSGGLRSSNNTVKDPLIITLHPKEKDIHHSKDTTIDLGVCECIEVTCEYCKFT